MQISKPAEKLSLPKRNYHFTSQKSNQISMLFEHECYYTAQFQLLAIEYEYHPYEHSFSCLFTFTQPFLVISFRQRTNPFNSFHIVFTAVTNKRMLPFGVFCFCFCCLCCPIKNGLHFQFALQKKHIVIHCDESNRSEPIRYCR